MKRYLLILAVLCSFSFRVYSQNRETYFKTIPQIDINTPEWARLMYSENPNVKEVDFRYHQYFQDRTFQKDIHTQNYKHWRRNIEQYINAEGYIHQQTKAEQDQFLDKLKAKRQNKGHRNLWTCIGPFETYNFQEDGNFPVSWQVNVYCFDQSLSNPSILFAGTESGGLFKSIDKGLNWVLVSADVPATTINDVKVSATDPNLVFFTSNDRIYRSVDGGDNWEEVFYTGDAGYQLEINPANPDIIFCAANNGFYRSTDQGENWEQIHNGKSWDVKTHPTNSDIVYALISDPVEKRCEFYKSTDAGETFTQKENGWYMPTDPSFANDMGARIGLTPASPDLIYVALIGESKANDNGWIGVYRSTDAGESWVNPNLPDGGPYNPTTHPNLASFNPNGTEFNQGFFNFSIAVSHNDPEKLWVGCLALSESSNAGANWTRIGAYYAQNDIGWIHPDIQDLHVLGNDIWVCNDGGITYSTDELQTHQGRKAGICGSEYWGFDQGWNEDVMVGGRYHNGNSGYYQTYGIGNTLRLGGAEASTGYINPLNNHKAAFSDINSQYIPESLDGQQVSLPMFSLYPNESYWESWSSEIEYDPAYANHLYLGNEGKLFKSINGGAFFSILYNFGANARILEIEISRNNPQTIYCVVQPAGGYWDDCVIKRSEDGGNSWTTVTNVPADRWRTEISLNPQDENELWVMCITGSNGNKVFKTSDGGESWMNMTTSVLDNERAQDIFYQGGTNNIVYLATTTGAFYWDENTQNWIDISENLPAWTKAMELKPFYAQNKLRMATGGRGIWEMDLIEASSPIAQPMTETDTLYCSRDTVQFDSYSIVDHEGTIWDWSIVPEPQFISSSSIRNPRVVFGYEGSYDVTLNITDGNGISNSKTIQNMVTIINSCGADTIPGKALECYSDGDFAATGDFNLTTNILTISAWVKPDGIQNDYTGIVMHNDVGAGINFRGGNNTLGYHWPGGSWSWNSNLIVPENEWSYVAMVANQSSMTLYVNGIAAVHNTNLQQVDLSSFDIGSYMGWDGRNFKGQIDEICIWAKALSQNEIREMRHLTKENYVNDPDLLAYYQFNEPNGDALNKAGSNHASLYGNAIRTESGAAVGSGSSQTQTVDDQGNYTYNNSGMSMNFNNSITPDGDVVVSRIHIQPNFLPNNFPNTESYWIVNNYGNNLSFPDISELILNPYYGVPAENIVADPNRAQLFYRNENADDNNWEFLGGASDAGDQNGGHFTFGADCGINKFGQFIITSDDQNTPLLDDVNIGTKKINNKLNLKIYPNPVNQNSELNIQYSGTDKIRVRIFNASGKLCKDIFVHGPALHKINVQDLSPGIYSYSITADSFIKNGSVIIR
ncbi:MAG: T9SS type A sorting domain-containing protein [Bacteroidales bacterium]|nr:T9SS type A sorting domain-containing protein [Bacteroidales bacterium]